MESSNLVEINNAQIENARNLGVLMDVDISILEKIRKNRRVMVYFCSDGRYTADIMQFIWSNTDRADIHVFADHGGALNLAKGCPILSSDSTLKKDRLAQITAAHLTMGYEILLNICHGPECKAMIGRGVTVNQAFDCYCTVAGEVKQPLPDLEVYDLFHRNKGENRLRLYQFGHDTWRNLRQSYPEPICLPGTDPVVRGLNA